MPIPFYLQWLLVIACAVSGFGGLVFKQLTGYRGWNRANQDPRILNRILKQYRPDNVGVFGGRAQFVGALYLLTAILLAFSNLYGFLVLVIAMAFNGLFLEDIEGQ